MARGGRRKRGGHESEHFDERWLVSYADMVTILMALFIVMFAMANVNTSKYEALKESLSGAFTPSFLSGGESVAETGGAAAVSPAVAPDQVSGEPTTDSAAQQESAELEALKQRVDAYARERGIESQLGARVERRGLVITILTDRLLFDSGSATMRVEGAELMHTIGELLVQEADHRVVVEGYTDTDPISTAQFPSNWELSTARASSVVRTLLSAEVEATRMTAAGRAYLDPIAPNSTAAGRSRNRRVQIVLPRQASPTGDAAAPDVGFDEPAFGLQETSRP